MKYLLILFLFAFFNSYAVFSHNNPDWLRQKFLKTGSVILVNHEVTAGFGRIDKKPKRKLLFQNC
jgi:hypothetical protein